MAGARYGTDPGAGLFPAGTISTEEDGGLSVRWGRAELIEWHPGGAEALAGLADSLHRMKGVAARASFEDVFREAIRAVGSAVTGRSTARKALARLESTLASALGPMIGVVAVGGISWDNAPLQLSDTILLGLISDDFEDQVNRFGSEHGISPSFRFDVDTRWPEDFAAMREDPSIAEEMDPWLPLLVAVAVDAIGGVGAYLAQQIVDSLLGAIWLARQFSEDWLHLPPWIIGDTVGDDEPAARSADHEINVFMYTHGDGQRPNREIAIGTWDCDLDELLHGPAKELIYSVANSHPIGATATTPATRLSAACRHAALGGRLLDPAQSLLHFTTALESLILVSPRDDVAATFRRRVARLLDDMPGGPDDLASRLGRIYDERSKVAHSGFSDSSLEVMGGRAREVLVYLMHAALRTASLVLDGISTDDELTSWLDGGAR